MSSKSVSQTSPANDRWQTAIVVVFHLIFLTIPLFFTWVNEELFEFNKIILLYMYTIIVMSLWVGRMISQQRIFLRKTPLDLPLVIFLVSQILSTIFSIHPRTSFFGYYTRFNGGLLSTLSYIALFYAFVSNVDRPHVKKIFLTMFGSALLVALIGIGEHFGHSVSCLLINTSRGAKELPLSSAWFQNVFNDQCWIQDVRDRVFATFGQPNWLAAYAITLLPLGMILSWKKKLWPKLFFATTTLLLFITVIFTQSRSGILGLVIGAGVFGLGFCWLQRQNYKKYVFLTLFGVAFLLLTLTFGFSDYIPNYGERLWQKHAATAVAAPTPTPQPTTANTLETGGSESGAIRRVVWTGALKVWERYPIFGSGVETFAYSYYKDRPMAHNLLSEWDFLYNKAHNQFLNYLATTGIVGFLAYVALMFMNFGLPLWYVFKKKLPEKTTTAALAISSGLIALNISNFFGFSTVMVDVLWFLFPAFFIVLSMDAWFFSVEYAGESEAPVRKNEQTFPWAKNVTLGFIFLITLGALAAVYSWWRADYLFANGKALIQAGYLGQGVDSLQQAIDLSPNEGVYYDELSSTYANLVASVADSDATAAAKLANQTYLTANQMIALNPVNVNFYKTKVRVLLRLAPLQPALLFEAKDTLNHAIELAPTDPKLAYFLGVVELGIKGEEQQAVQQLEKVIAMKPNYEPARDSLAKEYIKLGRFQDAIAQYQYILQNISPDSETTKKALADLAKLMATASAKLKR